MTVISGVTRGGLLKSSCQGWGSPFGQKQTDSSGKLTTVSDMFFKIKIVINCAS